MEEIYEERFSVNGYDRYKIEKKIGEGAFGEVKLGLDVQVGGHVALKYVRLRGGGGETGIPRAVFREMEALKQLKSPYVVELRDVFPWETNIVLVFEYMVSDLGDIISNSDSYLPMTSIKYITQAILRGISHCHANNILHRDVKPSNILINNNGQIKLADFGLARIFSTEAGAASMSHQVATRWYRAPELLFGARHYSFAVDMWAIGAVIAELLTFLPLFPGGNDIDQIFKVFQILGTPTPENWPDVNLLPDYNKVSFPEMAPLDCALCLPTIPLVARDFVFSLVSLNPEKRLTAAMALCHPFLQDTTRFCSFITEMKHFKPKKSFATNVIKTKGKTNMENLILSNVAIDIFEHEE